MADPKAPPSPAPTTPDTEVPPPATGSAEKPARLGQIDRSFYLVGVGASAGGLEAIKAFLKNIPSDCPHSFIFIQHISPDYKSMMGELLRRETSLTVVEVENGGEIEPGHVYIMPSTANVKIEGTHPAPSRMGMNTDGDEPRRSAEPRGQGKLKFALVDLPPRPQLNLPVDLFFNSLAEAVGDRAIGVVLSGTGSDGSRGLRAIKDADGLVMVQEPATAAFDGMPRAAMATQLVDFVVPPDQMAREIYRYVATRQDGSGDIDRMFDDNLQAFDNILRLVGAEAHIDFRLYKKPTLRRRIARRMAIKECATVDEYLDIIQRNPEEITILYREFLVGVTHFFRDLPAWEKIRTEVIPQIFADHDGDDPIKVWSVGCSTGEEAFTIAILMEDYRRESGVDKDFKVFATDVNERSLRIGREAVYPESAIEDIPPEYANTYFNYTQGGYAVTDAIRRRVIFSIHDVTENPPFINIELIICRNVLIYMTPPLQSRLIATFSFALRPNSYLLLGPSESVEKANTRLHPIDDRWRIYRNLSRATPGDIGPGRYSTATNHLVPLAQNIAFGDKRRSVSRDLDLSNVILNGMKACAIVVNPRMEIMETYGEYQRFVRLPEDGFSSSLQTLVTKRLATALSTALRTAEAEGIAQQNGLSLVEDAGVRLVDVLCKRVELESGQIRFVFVIRDVDEANWETLAAASRANGGGDYSDQTRYVAELETELAATRESLQATVVDFGASNEELQTSNEELMSANEELQSTNEELQSVNEELHTINAEHAQKIVELEAAYADIDNLLQSTDIATVFLDTDLRIRRFSTAITAQFNLDARDVGRPLAHFSSHLDASVNRRILKDAADILNGGPPTGHEVQTVDGRWYLARVRAFNNRSNEINGVVLTFVDITETKELQGELERQRDLLEAVLEGEMGGYWDWDLVRGTEYMSPQFKAMFGYADHEMENKPESWQRIIHPDDLDGVMTLFEKHVASRGKIPYDNEVRYYHKNGSIVWVWCRGQVIEWASDGTPLRMVGGHVDITPLKQREDDVLARAEEIRRFAYIAAHDLREPANTVQGHLQMLKTDLSDELDDTHRTLMGFVIEASQRMKDQIEGILEYAKLQDGELEFAPVDMAAAVRSAKETLSDAIAKTGATVAVKDLLEGMGSPVLLQSVVQNLISNALKFHDAKRSPEITISAARYGDDMIAYTVADNGIGIPPEFREQVFDIFKRLHASDEFDGTGLGLALCRKIIMQHRGKIWIESHDGPGTRVTFTIPRPGGAPVMATQEVGDAHA